MGVMQVSMTKRGKEDMAVGVGVKGGEGDCFDWDGVCE